MEKVGPSVTRVKPGDHVLLTFMPACGKCRFCSMGQSFTCYRGAGVILSRAPGDEDVRRALVVAAKTFFSIKMSVREPSLTNYNSTRLWERT